MLTLLVFARSIAAEPVQVGETEGADEAPATFAPLSERPLADRQASPHAESTPSASTIAVEIIKEADAGAPASEQPRSAQRANAAATIPATLAKPSATRQGGADADPWGLREIGNAAVHWLKDTLPWLRSDTDESSAAKAVALDAADWSTSPLDDSASGRGSRAGSTQLTSAVREAPSDPTLAVGYGTSAALALQDPDQDIVRLAINLIREVLEHPMTWLVVSLFVIGGIAVKKIDRRPTK